MSFLAKVEALRATFSIAADVPLPNAVCGMSQAVGRMGLPHKLEFHPLPVNHGDSNDPAWKWPDLRRSR